MAYLSKHDKANERAACEAGYHDRLAEAQEGLCVSRGPGYRTTIVDLRGKIKALLEVLQAVEWSGMNSYGLPRCPICYGRKSEDWHYEDCKLEAAIALATEVNDEAG